MFFEMAMDNGESRSGGFMMKLATLIVDKETMEELLSLLSPRADTGAVALRGGTLQISVEGDAIAYIRVGITGEALGAPFTLRSELTVDTGEGSYALPERVITALTGE